MALRFDRDTVRRFGALDDAQRVRVQAVVDAARQSAIEARNLASNPVRTAWAWITGASSTAQALNTNAYAAETLYETIKAKADRIMADAYASEWDVLDLESATSAFGNKAASEAADLLSPVTALTQTASGTYQDITQAVKNPLGIPVWAWLLGAGALAVLILGRK